jgi:hypothetical protein
MGGPTTIEVLVASQARMIAALDGRYPDDITAATAELAAAIAAAKQDRPGPAGRADASLIDHALRQNDAARMRVNILSGWNRNRMDRLSELRNASHNLTYRRR